MSNVKGVKFGRTRNPWGNSSSPSASGPVKLKSYTVSTLPSAATYGAGSLVYVSDASGTACAAWSDGTNWKRADTGATVS